MTFSTIVKKEIQDNVYNFRYGIILALSMLVIGTSVFIMYRDYCSRVENYEILRPDSKEAIAIISPSPLSIFVKGVDENLCRAYQIDALGINLGSGQQAINKLFGLFTSPDLLYIIRIVLSLCALLMAYDMVTREKENGTLRHVLANRVKRPVFLLAKWTGGFVSFIVPVLFIFLFTVTVVSLLPMVQFSAADYGKIALFILTSVIYLAVFFTFGMLASCLTSKSVTALMVSIFFWVMMVFVIPNLGNNISKQLVKTTSIEQLEQQQRLTWAKSVFDRINGGKNAGSGWEQLSLAYAAEVNKQTRVSKIVSQCSPAGAFILFATDMMNTGLTEQNKLKNNVWEYYNSVKNARSDSDGNFVGEFPVFNYQRCNLHEAITANSIPMVLLITFVLLFFTIAYTAFMRYDLR